MTDWDLPEAQHLAAQEKVLAELTERLTSEEADFAAVGIEMARFRIEFLRRCGHLYAELDQLDAEISAHFAQQQPGSTWDEIAARAAERAESTQDFAEAEIGREPNEPSVTLRDLFKRAAKLYHPDLVTDPVERAERTKAMAKINAAYRDGDADLIRGMIQDAVASPELIAGDDTASRLIRTLRHIAQVRRRLEELAGLRQGLEADPLWELFGEVEAATESGHDLLNDIEAELRARIAAGRAQLAAIRM